MGGGGLISLFLLWVFFRECESRDCKAMTGKGKLVDAHVFTTFCRL